MFNTYPYGGYPQYGAQMSGLKGRPVSSVEEVRAAQVDFDGSLFIFPDIADKKIYTKQINLDGTAALRTYSLVEETAPPPAYITREELDSILDSFKSSLTLKREEKANGNNKSESVKTNGTDAVFAF